MIRVHVFAEGPSEQIFIREVLEPHLRTRSILATARLVGGQGGDVRLRRVVRDIASSIKADRSARFTTLFDYYGLHADWGKTPGIAAKGSAAEAARLEARLEAEVAREVGSELMPNTFIAYLQVHEFESLLFSSVEQLGRTLDVDPQKFASIADSCGGPELINDSQTTAPSKRIALIALHFQKTVHGLSCAKETGVAAIRERCPRFACWLERLERLPESA